MRGVVEGGTGLGKGREGRNGNGLRGDGISRYRCRRDMPGQGVRIAASAIPVNTTHARRLLEGEGLVPSHRAAARRDWQRGQGQVVHRSEQCIICVSATAVEYTESDLRRPGSALPQEEGRWAGRRPHGGLLAGPVGRRRRYLTAPRMSGPAPQLGLKGGRVGMGRPRAGWVSCKPRNHKATLELADSQFGGGDVGACCAAGASVAVGRVRAGSAIGAGGRRTEGAGKVAFAAEVEAPAVEAAPRLRLAGWLRTDGT
eukprot:6214302-Pleurochrysis_carterae.AAC.1